MKVSGRSIRAWPTRRTIRSAGHNRVPATERDLHARGVPLLDLLDRSLDKGVVIDGWASVPVLGCDLITLDARMFVASFETYLKYAAAVKDASDIAISEAADAMGSDGADIQSLPQPSQARQDVALEGRRDVEDSFRYDGGE